MGVRGEALALCGCGPGGTKTKRAEDESVPVSRLKTAWCKAGAVGSLSGTTIAMKNLFSTFLPKEFPKKQCGRNEACYR